MNAFTPIVPTFPQNPKVGQMFGQYVFNGTQWVCAPGPGSAVIRVFTSSTTYWPSPGLTFAIVEAIGGGGGGGGALGTWASVAAGGWVVGGGGGASGAYSRSPLSVALLLNGVPVAVGAGGLAGTETTNGGQGGTSSFGQFVTAPGGNGGSWNNPGTGLPPNPANPWGLGGLRVDANSNIIIGTGSVTVPTDAGSNGLSLLAQANQYFGAINGGRGGRGFMGSGGIEAQASRGEVSVGSGGFMGDGGGGGASGFTTPAEGGAGGAGAIIVTELCFGNTSPVQNCGCVTEVPVGFQVPWGAA